jgi:hypothetical protein
VLLLYFYRIGAPELLPFDKQAFKLICPSKFHINNYLWYHLFLIVTAKKNQATDDSFGTPLWSH